MTPEARTTRGTKRRCQNETCGLPFYDLNRSAIVCPNCASAFVIPVQTPRAEYRGRSSRAFPAPPPRLIEQSAEVEVATVDESSSDQPLLEPADDTQVLEVEEEEQEDTLPLSLEDETNPEE
jgi:hypothetical protein